MDVSCPCCPGRRQRRMMLEKLAGSVLAIQDHRRCLHDMAIKTSAQCCYFVRCNNLGCHGKSSLHIPGWPGGGAGRQFNSHKFSVLSIQFVARQMASRSNQVKHRSEARYVARVIFISLTFLWNMHSIARSLYLFAGDGLETNGGETLFLWLFAAFWTARSVWIAIPSMTSARHRWFCPDCIARVATCKTSVHPSPSLVAMLHLWHRLVSWNFPWRQMRRCTHLFNTCFEMF